MSQCLTPQANFSHVISLHTMGQILDATCHAIHLLTYCLFPSLNDKLQESKDFIWFIAISLASSTGTKHVIIIGNTLLI